jgi:hypothetical protein
MESPKTRRGWRRGAVRGTLVAVRLQPPELALLDAWRATEPDEPTRPEAIRRLLSIALTWRAPAKGTAVERTG